MMAELADNATTEEINEFVDNMIAEAEETEKPDAQQIAEDHDKTPIADTANDESAEGETPEGEESGNADAQAPEWLDDDLKAEGSAYGLSEEQLAEFTSREEVERAFSLFDRAALEAGRKALAEGQAEGESTEEEPQSKEQPATTAGYESGLKKEMYDEEFFGDITGEFARLHDHFAERFSYLEQRLAEADLQVEEQKFDGIVDTLGHADLFGKTGKENSRQLKRRQDLLDEVRTMMAGRKTLGRQVEMNDSLVNRVARGLFAEDIGKKELKAKTRKVSRQADSRQGGGATKAREPQESLREEMRRLHAEYERQSPGGSG
jgi:hypothetical protein